MKKKHLILKKYLKIFNVGLLAFLIVEGGVLLFVDKSYLKENTGNVQVQHITNNTSSDTADLKITLTGSEKDIKSSYDGKFIAYTLNGDLIIHSIKTDVKKTIKADKNMKINFYKWVYDRSNLVIAEKNTKSSSSAYVKLYKIETKKLAETSEPEEIRNSVDDQTAKIMLPSSSYDVSDIDCSTSTVTTYLKLTSGTKTSKLWKFNVPQENKMYSNIKTKNIGKMQSLKYTDKLFFENKDKNIISTTDGKTLTINGSKNYQIVGFDNKDNVYLAKGSSSTTNEILYGSLMQESSTGETFITNAHFQSINLPSSVSIKDINVTLNGVITVNDSAENTVMNAQTGKKTSYTGKIVGFYAKGFLTMDSSNVVKQNPFS